MRGAVRVPVTVKCRIGVDDQVPQASLRAARCGVREARALTPSSCMRAWRGWTVCRQRIIATRRRSDYELVYAIKRENPALTIVLNGGIATLDEAQAHLKRVDGVMLWAALAYQSTPAILAEVDARFFGGLARTVEAAVEAYLGYVEVLDHGVPLHAMTCHGSGCSMGGAGARQRPFAATFPRMRHGRARTSQCCATRWHL